MTEKKRVKQKEIKSNTKNSPIWNIRGVDKEVQTLLKKTAKKHNLSLGKYFNTILRELITADLKGKKEEIQTIKPNEINKQLSEILDKINRFEKNQEQISKKGNFVSRIFSKKT